MLINSEQTERYVMRVDGTSPNNREEREFISPFGGGQTIDSDENHNLNIADCPVVTKNTIKPIVFACDENYAPYLPVVLRSLLDNTSPAVQYEVILLDCSLNTHSKIFAEIKNDIKTALSVRENFSFRIIAVGAALAQNSFLQKNKPALKRYSYATYARILIPDLLPDYEKVLYFDIDHIILDDVAHFFDFPLEDKLIAAVPDINVAYERLMEHSHRKNLVEEKLQLAADNYYIIASPMLLNIPACRNFGFTEKVLAILSREISLPFPDQDAINAVCKGHILYLPQKWGRANARNFSKLCQTIRLQGTAKQNQIILADWREDSDDNAVIHYVTTPKPWNGIEADYAALWWRYAVRTENSGNLFFSLLFPLSAQGNQSYVRKSYKIFGIPFLTIKNFPQGAYYYVGNIPFAQTKYGKENCYIYIFGVKILTVKTQQIQECL